MSKPPSPTKPYKVYKSTAFNLVEKSGTKGGSHSLPKAYHGHEVWEFCTSTNDAWRQTSCYNNWDFDIGLYGPWARIESRLHSKVQDLLGEQAEIGTTLAEYSSALAMIQSGATRLASAALALRKGRFRDFLGALNARPLPKHRNWVRSSPKIASKLWIEYWFGWSPTINDIQTAGRILDSEPPVGSIPYSVATGVKWHLKKAGNLSYPSYNINCHTYGKTGGEYRMVNPNLALAQKLGVLNPLTIAVNVTPWSWLVGWFVNLNQWVDSLTAFSGYKFSNCYTTHYTVFQGEKRWDWQPAKYATFYVEGMLIDRYLRMPKVALHLKTFNLSLTRASTAVSLLTLRLKSL